jgi:hypothetical protein
MRTVRLVWVFMLASACAQADESEDQSDVMTQNDSAQYVARNLATFDSLDFAVFSNQQWDRLKESHAQDIIVTWPDGHETRGIDKHIEDLKAMFVYAPDTQIEEHPIRIGNGSWTAVTGVMTGTFTRVMPMPDGTTLQPTGKKFRLPMATVAHWTAEGVMDHEWLFWDNQTYMKQLGLQK